MSRFDKARRALHTYLCAYTRSIRPMVRRCASGALALAGAGVIAAGAASGASANPATPAAGHYTGTLADGATWIADVPANWNGTLLLYSHGYGPLNAQDAPDGSTQAELLSEGYAMAGSSYDPHGSWWALGSAVRDQFQTLSTVEQTILKTTPQRVYAFGTSMGGLISALEDQNSDGRLDGALTTCGIVAGGAVMNQYQLEGEWAISRLLAPGQNIQLTNFKSGVAGGFADSAAAAKQLLAAGDAAQQTPQGRARLALAMAFMNVSPWGDATPPSIYDYAAQEQGQYDDYFTGGPASALAFIMEGRDQIELAAGGEAGGTVGVDFAKLLHRSSYYPEVKALYNEADLNLRDDLQTLTSDANLRANPRALRWLQQTSAPNGRLQVPELDLKTISDQLVPVQQESYYHALVARAGDRDLLRQAFVNAQGHCNFTPAELVAGVHALATRVSTGSWDGLTSSTALNAAADALPTALKGGAFLPFWPDRLTGVPSPFSHHFGRRLPFAHHSGRRPPLTHRSGHRRF